MKLWLDAQLPPQLAVWLTQHFGVVAVAVRDLGLRDATDLRIFEAARAESAVLVSKDIDFVNLVQARGTPPQLIWVTCGNVTNTRLRGVFEATFAHALSLLADARPIVEIGDLP
jgi:predicted nuclease of predicted toxin-antitoxin system